MALIDELDVIHQAAFPSIDQERQVRLPPGHWCHQELLSVLRERGIFLDELLVAELASGQRVEVQHIRDESPLLGEESVVPFDERKLNLGKRNE